MHWKGNIKLWISSYDVIGDLILSTVYNPANIRWDDAMGILSIILSVILSCIGTEWAQDSKLRMALENMRYKSCTPQDIEFLRMLIAGRGPNDPKLAQKRFRNVSIITALNAQKDKINELGCRRFATENHQTLTSFYSIDKWRDPDERRRGPGQPKKNVVDPARKKNVLSLHVQHILWEQPHASSDKHIPGKLDLCVGLPVMLRHNEATECCITKGAEAMVVGWQSVKGPAGQNVLDTLFVKLKDPPKTVTINGLPDNVVPLTRRSTAVWCSLPNDDVIPLSREQVPVLPNFAMTDYASQGRTQPDNVIDLNNNNNNNNNHHAPTPRTLLILSDLNTI